MNPLPCRHDVKADAARWRRESFVPVLSPSRSSLQVRLRAAAMATSVRYSNVRAVIVMKTFREMEVEKGSC